MLLRPVSAGLAALVLSACGANRYCVVEQEYQRAQTVPELQPADGLILPQSPSALRLPAAPAERLPFGTVNEEGAGVCLDKPPDFIEPPEEATPAPPAKAS